MMSLREREREIRAAHMTPGPIFACLRTLGCEFLSILSERILPIETFVAFSRSRAHLARNYSLPKVARNVGIAMYVDWKAIKHEGAPMYRNDLGIGDPFRYDNPWQMLQIVAGCIVCCTRPIQKSHFKSSQVLCIHISVFCEEERPHRLSGFHPDDSADKSIDREA